ASARPQATAAACLGACAARHGCRAPRAAPATAAAAAQGRTATTVAARAAAKASGGAGPLVAFILGGPGSGKGTQCERVVRELGYTHLSAGDLLRAERQREGSELGGMIESTIRSGGVVPGAVIAALLEQAMREA
ncbi:unnamed protein product, partial [Prorocentrum cordatum]